LTKIATAEHTAISAHSLRGQRTKVPVLTRQLARHCDGTISFFVVGNFSSPFTALVLWYFCWQRRTKVAVIWHGG